MLAIIFELGKILLLAFGVMFLLCVFCLTGIIIEAGRWEMNEDNEKGVINNDNN